MAGAVALAIAPAVARPPDAALILRRAEDIRNPDLDFAVDFELTVLVPSSSAPERKASYTLVAHGRGRSIILMRTPEQFYGGTLLIDEGLFWLLLPRAAKPFQLAEAQIVRGDIGAGDLARANLGSHYEASLAGKEPMEGRTCWRLELARKNNRAFYPRITAWISTDAFLPRKFDYYDEAGTLIKIARYEDYEKSAIGLRPMRIDVEDPLIPGNRSIMVFREARKMPTAGIEFTPDGMIAFRDAALAKRGAGVPQPRPEEFLHPSGP